MTRRERVSAYAIEPTARLSSPCWINWLNEGVNINFMHSTARDLLSILLVLLGASLALWIGLFWVSNTDFGEWLAERDELMPINGSLHLDMRHCVTEWQ